MEVGIKSSNPTKFPLYPSNYHFMGKMEKPRKQKKLHSKFLDVAPNKVLNKVSITNLLFETNQQT